MRKLVATAYEYHTLASSDLDSLLHEINKWTSTGWRVIHVNAGPLVPGSIYRWVAWLEHSTITFRRPRRRP